MPHTYLTQVRGEHRAVVERGMHLVPLGMHLVPLGMHPVLWTESDPGDSMGGPTLSLDPIPLRTHARGA